MVFDCQPTNIANQKSVESALTMEQRQEAEEMAAEWLKKAAKSQSTLTRDQLTVTTVTRKPWDLGLTFPVAQ